jgi:di/tricarboxylate transporter
MTPILLTSEMLLVFAVMGVAIFLFLVDWLRVDIVALLIMIILPMLGLVSGSEAFSGLSSNAVVSIIAVIIMGRGLDHTGVVSSLVRPLVRLTGNKRSRIIAMLSLTIAFISSVMQNIGAAALFLPAVRRIGRQSGIALSRLLMPVGFAAILGGTITLVGSSPLIMLNDLLAPFQIAPLGLFSVMPIGIALVIAGIGFFVVFGNWVLPDRREDDRAAQAGCPVIQYYGQLGELIEMIAPADAAQKPLICDMCDRFQVHTVALDSIGDHKKLMPPARTTVVQPGTVLAVYGTRPNVAEAAEFYGFRVQPQLKRFAVELSDEFAGLVEAVVPPHSQFIGKTLGEIHFRHNYLVAPIAIYREDRVIYANLAEQQLHAGDAILMHGKWERFQQFRLNRDLIFSHALDHEILHPQKAGAALACFVLATALVFFTAWKLSVCLMVGALGMILTRVITIDEAYAGVDWRTVFLLAGLIPLGIAMEKTGAAAYLAQQLLDLLGAPTRLVFLFAVGLMATVFTLIVSNVGATVLLIPLVISLSQDIGVDPRTAALVVGVAASNSFLLPTHQVNALYMGPGRYKSRDFLRAGAPLSMIFLLVLVLVVYAFY